MQYRQVVRGEFLDRPNRFIAHVEVGGEVVTCHVKNTGRCRELLTPHATVILEKAENGARKTPYDVVAVYKGTELINMDSMAPNKVFAEWLRETDFFGELTFVRPETVYGNSRFDFYMEGKGEGERPRRIFTEVKGVTLEEDGVVLFPDAPTDRGVKHIHELMAAKAEGYEAYLFFVIQMAHARYFAPNEKTHAAFAAALREAVAAGVGVYAVNCKVTESTLTIDRLIETRI